MNKNLRNKLVVGILALALIALLGISVAILSKVSRIKGDTSEEAKLLYMTQINQTIASILDDATHIDAKRICEYVQENELQDTPLLIIRYSNFSCSSCLNNVVKGLGKAFPDYQSNKRVLFVVSDLKTKPQKKLGNTITLKYGENWGLESENTNEPCLFILFNGTVFHIFTPNSRYNAVYEAYLETIKEKYFS